MIRAPALPTIAFAALAAAGHGLLAWLGISIALLSLRGTVAPALDAIQLLGLGLGLLLSTVGLLVVLVDLRRPQQAWHALTQWRSSWPSRTAVLAAAAAWPALMVAGLLLWAPADATRAAWLACFGILLGLLALATVASTAMLQASVKPIPAWSHPLVVPVQLLFALLTGLGLMFVLMAWLLAGQGPAAMAVTLAVVGALLVPLKWLYWHEIGQAPGVRASRRGRAPTLSQPATAPNHVARGGAFDLARRHAFALRLAITLALFFVPMMAVALLATGSAGALPAMLMAALGTLAGAFMERWLFHAEARHLPPASPERAPGAPGPALGSAGRSADNPSL